MIVVHHRRNTLEELKQSEHRFGIEVDIRNHGNDLIVYHDPFHVDAVNFEVWLEAYQHNFLIANVKEEGLEERLVPLLEEASIDAYFILDESLPYIRKHALAGLPNFAVRVSEFESVETALRLSDYLKGHGKRFDWIWIDSFTGEPAKYDDAMRLREAGLKLCQVSPELHHVNEPNSWQSRVEDFFGKLEVTHSSPVFPDMVCTKLPTVWEAQAKKWGA